MAYEQARIVSQHSARYHAVVSREPQSNLSPGAAWPRLVPRICEVHMSRMKTPDTSPEQTNVVQLQINKKERRRAEDKWTPAVIKLGYTPLPSLLLRAQAKLKINPIQLNVLIQIIEHWWDAGKNPWPAKETIARRMDKSPRQIQRILTQLEKAGHIKRIKRFLGYKAQTSNAYSLDGLVKKLVALEPEFRKAIEQNKIRRRKVEAGTAA
jgi:hypothetical protein